MEPMRHEDIVKAASFSSDGRPIVVTASFDKTARVWDAESGKPVGEPMRHESFVYAASFSPDGRRIVTSSYDKTARVWDTDSGKPVGEPMRHEGIVKAASFWTLTIIPLFLMIKTFGFYGSWWALILPYAASAQPLLVLLFRGFFEQIPRELLQSARLDGAREWQVLLKVVAPLTRPIILTGTILMTINIWGDYLWPVIVLQDYRKYTISAGLQEFVSNMGIAGNGTGAVFAAYLITMLPLFILVGFSMRYFVAGITEGALKL